MGEEMNTFVMTLREELKEALTDLVDSSREAVLTVSPVHHMIHTFGQ